MELLAAFATIFLVNLLAWLTPGPNMFAVIGATLAGGWRSGVATGLGLATAALIWAGAAVLGIAALFELFPEVAYWFRLIGAAYLIWLGVKSIRASVRARVDGLPHGSAGFSKSPGAAYVTGFLVSVTNPKAALFFGSVLTAVLPTDASGMTLAAVAIFCGMLGVIFHTITASVFSSGPVRRVVGKAGHILDAVFGTVFIALGVGVAFDVLRRH